MIMSNKSPINTTHTSKEALLPKDLTQLSRRYHCKDNKLLVAGKRANVLSFSGLWIYPTLALRKLFYKYLANVYFKTSSSCSESNMNSSIPFVGLESNECSSFETTPALPSARLRRKRLLESCRLILAKAVRR